MGRANTSAQATAQAIGRAEAVAEREGAIKALKAERRKASAAAAVAVNGHRVELLAQVVDLDRRIALLVAEHGAAPSTRIARAEAELRALALPRSGPTPERVARGGVKGGADGVARVSADGSATVARLVREGRLTETLAKVGAAWAEDWAFGWQDGGLTQSWAAGVGGGRVDDVSERRADARRRYDLGKAAMAPVERPVVTSVVIHGATLEDAEGLHAGWFKPGSRDRRAYGVAWLRSGLERLATVYRKTA